MLPAGGYKGAGIALIVEILAGVLIGTNLSFQASSFVNNEGGPPRTGQFFIAIDPRAFLGERFEPRLETLLQAIEADADVRLPGDKRLAARAHAQTHGVSIDADLYERISALGREH